MEVATTWPAIEAQDLLIGETFRFADGRGGRCSRKSRGAQPTTFYLEWDDGVGGREVPATELLALVKERPAEWERDSQAA